MSENYPDNLICWGRVSQLNSQKNVFMDSANDQFIAMLEKFTIQPVDKTILIKAVTREWKKASMKTIH
jgi:hypothetical protein